MKKPRQIILIVLCAAFFVGVSHANAAVTFNTSTTLGFSAKTTVTSSITVGSGNNQLLVIELTTPTSSPTAVTVDGTAATKAVSYNANSHDIDIWYITGLSAAAHVVSATYAAAATGNLGVASYFGIQQSNPLDKVSTSSVSSAKVVTTTITTTAADDLLVDGSSHATETTDVVNNANQTLVYTKAGTTNLNDESYMIATSTQSYLLGWTYTALTTALTYAIVAFKAVPPDATSISTTFGGDGGRSGDSITITGTNFGTVAAASRATCNGGAGTGCIKFIVGGTDTVPSSSVSAWTTSSITFTVPSGLNSNGGAAAVQVWAVNASDTSPLSFYIYPRISAISSVGTNAARTYNASDTDGVIMLSGDHFGTTTGTSTILGVLATLFNSTGGSCLYAGFSSTTACFEVPSTIGSSTYSGTIILDRASDNKQATTSLSILPRILSVSPTSTSTGSVVQILGDHLCPSGSCPVSPNRSSVTNNVTFGNNPAVTFIASSSATGGATSQVTPATNTTGASLIVVAGTTNNGTSTISDSMGNTWYTLNTDNDGSGDYGQLFYTYAPTTSAAQTFTLTAVGAAQYPSLFVSAWSGTLTTSNPFDTQNNSSSAVSGNTVNTDFVTPASTNDLLITGFGGGTCQSASNFSLTGGFTVLGVVGMSGCQGEPAGMGYLVDSSTASLETTWSWTTAFTSKVATIAAFKSAAPPNAQAMDSDFVNETGGAGACNGSSAAWATGEICVQVPAAALSGSASTTVTQNSLTSNAVPFTVLGSVPGAPGTPTYSSVSTSTLTVNWSAATNATYYKIERATSSQVYAQITTTTATSYGDSGLAPNSTYYYRVRATNATGDGSYSATSSVLTLPAAPGTPIFTNVSTSTLTVNWTPPTGGATYYEVDRAPNSGGSPGTFAMIATTTATSTGDTGLSQGTIYWYRVAGWNTTGSSTYSGNASTTTGTTANSPPNAPTTSAPASGIGDVSVNPTFVMAATDPDGNNVQYRVVLFTNSACTATSTIYSEATSQTGWSGQNATSSSPGDSYLSSSQATYVLQSPSLATGTLYYWNASAIDPTGSNTWGAPSGCNNFTSSAGKWTTDSGVWSITSGHLTVVPSLSTVAQLHISGLTETTNPIVVEFKAKETGGVLGTGGVAGIVRADSGTNRYQIVTADMKNSKLEIQKTISGAYTILASATMPFAYSHSVLTSFRGYSVGSSLMAWASGSSSISVTDPNLSSGYVGLSVSSTSPGVTFTISDFAVYSWTTITMNNLPAGGSWAVLDSTGAGVVGCQTGSTLDISTYAGQVPIDYDNGGGQVAVWATSNNCMTSGNSYGTATAYYPSQFSLANNIFGGDTYTFNPNGGSGTSGGGTPIATSSITINSTGEVSY